jgi:hypothetical protein
VLWIVAAVAGVLALDADDRPVFDDSRHGDDD